jgi:hypothetical protein
VGGKKRKLINDSDYESNDEASSSCSQNDEDVIMIETPEFKKLNKFLELLLKFIINSDQPISLVESGDFKNLIKYLNKNVVVPCRQTFTNHIDLYYGKVRNEILYEISKVDYVSYYYHIM